MAIYIVFDVETPNRANDRMSAIGITAIKDNKIVANYFDHGGEMFIVNIDKAAKNLLTARFR